jgi:aquaporin Z
MGVSVAITTYLIIRSPFGRRSGAHINPAITIAYWWLDRIHHWDVLGYVAAQFFGGISGVLLAREVLGYPLSAMPVRYVITVPGRYGGSIALLFEGLFSALLMLLILFSANRRRLVKFSPVFVASATVLYFLIGPSIAGFSVNPARSFASALFARTWYGLWIYFVGPIAGMSIVALVWRQINGASSVYCAKVFHDCHSTCPFQCEFHRLQQKDCD